jgi:anti-sigma factor RsiW
MSECVNPSELEEGALMAHVDGEEVSQKVQDHLARCPHCVAQVAAYRRSVAVLRATLHRRSCPAPEQLGLYQLNLLSAGERLVLAKHVRECPYCEQELQELAREGDQPSLLEKLHQVVEVVEATLLPVPRLQVTPLRGALSALQRFRVEGVDIHVSVQPGHSRGTRTVMVRLLPQGELLPAMSTEAWLMRDKEAWAAPIEAEGVFAFEGVQPGKYSLGLECDGQAVVMREVEVM